MGKTRLGRFIFLLSSRGFVKKKQTLIKKIMNPTLSTSLNRYLSYVPTNNIYLELASSLYSNSRVGRVIPVLPESCWSVSLLKFPRLC